MKVETIAVGRGANALERAHETAAMNRKAKDFMIDRILHKVHTEITGQGGVTTGDWDNENEMERQQRKQRSVVRGRRFRGSRNVSPSRHSLATVLFGLRRHLSCFGQQGAASPF